MFVRRICCHSSWRVSLSTVLVKEGRILHGPLGREHMSRDDLDEDLREQGMAEPSKVAEARLERSGKLSVIGK